MSGTRPVALARAAISIIVLLPSTNSVSILGFISLDKAIFLRLSGVASLSKGLFFPLPAATTLNAKLVAKSYNSLIAPGSSPAPIV